MEPNKYELGVIVRADLEDETFRAEMERVKGFVDRFGGTIEKVDEWGRRKLAYPIKKLNEGMYTFITYTAIGDTANKVEDRLRLMENVLRFLTVRRDEVEAPVKVELDKSEEQVVESVVVETPETAAPVESSESSDSNE